MLILNIEELVKEMKSLKGVDLNSYSSDFLIRKIENRMLGLKVKTGQAYLEKLKREPAEADNLMSEIGIQVSLFFRNPLVFEIIRERTLPSILDTKRVSGSRELRIWSAGCSSGEEAYSAAIILHQILKEEIKNWQIMIFATDIDRGIIKQAEKGVFPRAKLVDTKMGIVDEYFTQSGDEYRVKQFIRKMVDFSFDDLASTDKGAPSASIFGAFDLVLCRNVMIYFTEASRNVVQSKIISSLNRGGYLVLGEAEWLTDSNKSELSELDERNRIFRKK